MFKLACFFLRLTRTIHINRFSPPLVNNLERVLVRIFTFLQCNMRDLDSVKARLEWSFMRLWHQVSRFLPAKRSYYFLSVILCFIDHGLSLGSFGSLFVYPLEVFLLVISLAIWYYFKPARVSIFVPFYQMIVFCNQVSRVCELTTLIDVFVDFLWRLKPNWCVCIALSSRWYATAVFIRLCTAPFCLTKLALGHGLRWFCILFHPA